MSPEVLSAIIAGVISLLISSFVAVWVQRKQLASDYDVALRTERLTEYRKLWHLTEPLGWYGNHEITPETAKKFLASYDHWYFENGSGLLLSDLSLDVFEELLLALDKYDGNPDEVRKIGTRLRSALTYDIGGRSLPLLRRRPHSNELAQKILKVQN